jgi:putative Mn2+ efflux pump MntP
MTIGLALLAFSMALDVFAGGLALGIVNHPRDRWIKTAVIFASLGVLFLLVGDLLGELLSGASGSIASYVAGGALVILGLRALYDTLFGHGHEEIEKPPMNTRSILLTGSAVSLDKLAVGISLAVVEISILPALAYLAVQGFVATLLGLALGKRLGSRLGDVAHLLAGSVFVVLGAIILIQAIRHRSVP